jgi:hypothetical protein
VVNSSLFIRQNLKKFYKINQFNLNPASSGVPLNTIVNCPFCMSCTVTPNAADVSVGATRVTIGLEAVVIFELVTVYTLSVVLQAIDPETNTAN